MDQIEVSMPFPVSLCLDDFERADIECAWVKRLFRRGLPLPSFRGRAALDLLQQFLLFVIKPVELGYGAAGIVGHAETRTKVGRREHQCECSSRASSVS